MLQSWFKNNACNVTKILKFCFKFNYLCVETTEFFFFFFFFDPKLFPIVTEQKRRSERQSSNELSQNTTCF